MERVAIRFVKWGTGFLVLALMTGYGPLGHYLMGGVEIACPWAPVHGHVSLLGWMGLTLFGLVYLALERRGGLRAKALGMARAHFWLAIVAVLGVYGNGIVGYRVLDAMSPSFYYLPETGTLNLWLTIDGAFLSLYGVGCLLFMAVVFGARPHGRSEARAA